VRLLLDSHVFLWWRAADPRLDRDVTRKVLDAAEVFVSAATAWELGLKVSLGKLRVPDPIEDGVRDSGFQQLPVTFEHTRIATFLPLHHKDPFDRMLVAQARAESLTLVTHDRAMEPYDVPILWVG
jgi:PIN domain nuclease of toxin-antitoxin system